MAISERSGSSIIPYLPEEAAEFEEKVGRYREGQESEGDFQAYRLRRGVYGQRQVDRQMIRIKIPLGVTHSVTPFQGATSRTQGHPY